MASADDIPPRDQLLPEVTWDGQVFHTGDRVRLVDRVGALTPAETGHPRQLLMGPGQRGTLLGAFDLPTGSRVLAVRWDAQGWHEWTPPIERMEMGRAYSGAEIVEMSREVGPLVELPAFESSIHPAYVTTE